jgi:2-polyprenyl-3-methyl-5-hydroxy-6-metoxy-1,4-benzoquinol methylase
MSTATWTYSHQGWEDYYRNHISERAWNGRPDEFLMEHIEELILRDTQAILDVGAGDGRNSEPFLNRGFSVVATDLSPTALSTFGHRCREDWLQQPLLIYGDFLSIHFLPNQFDVVICFNAISHFERPMECLNKMIDLLRPGGRLIFNAFTPNDVAYGHGENVDDNKFYYKETLFTFMTADLILGVLPPSVSVIRSETRRWQEPDHGEYRRGVHTHEACFFILEKRSI